MKRISLLMLPSLAIAAMLAVGCQDPTAQSSNVSGVEPPVTEDTAPPEPAVESGGEGDTNESTEPAPPAPVQIASNDTVQIPNEPAPADEPANEPADTNAPADEPADEPAEKTADEAAEEKPAAPARPAPPAALTIGDPHPGLAVAKWIKGDPVSEPLKDKVHVVEFWATWCGPCRTGMPHISELQKKFANDVAFIGVTREDEETVQAFLEKESPQGKTWNEVIQYRLALDQADWTNTAYMRAAGQNGIPCAFIVGREGIVEWIGHPATIDEPLQKVIAGEWDREAAIKAFEAEKKMRGVMMAVNKHARSGDWDAALTEIDKLQEEIGASDKLLQLRWQVLLAAERPEEANKAAGQLVESAWEDARMLNQLAWGMANNKGDLDLALKAATQASELEEHKNASIMDTVAFCHYQLGNLDKAIEWQEKAVAVEGHPQLKASLERYKAEKAKGAEGEAKEAPPEDKPAEEKPAEEAADQPAEESAAEEGATEAAAKE